MATTPALKLTYFDFDGRAAVIRKTLTVGGVPFVDERLSKDQFEQRKASFPYGKVPVLEVDGGAVAESQAILRYAGRLTGMYPPPSEPLAAALVDEVIDSFDDVFERTLAPSFAEKDKEKKKQMREELLKSALPHAMEMIQARLQQLQEHAYFKQDPSKVYLYEVLVWDYVQYIRSGEIEHIPTTFLDEFKTLIAMHAKVKANPNVQQRPIGASTGEIASRPKQLKLSYFDLPFRAEHIRLALHIGGIAFEDERLSWDDVIKRRPDFPNDQVPVLWMEDHSATSLAQSNAILRYVGTLTGLYPVQDALRAMQIDEVLSHIGELYFSWLPSLAERDREKSRAMRAQLVATTIPESLEALDRRLAYWKSQPGATPSSSFVFGAPTLTIADLAVYTMVLVLRTGFLGHVPTTIADKYEQITAVVDAVKQHPRVQDWYALHPTPTI